jgi:hypothetical protein
MISMLNNAAKTFWLKVKAHLFAPHFFALSSESFWYWLGPASSFDIRIFASSS